MQEIGKFCAALCSKAAGIFNLNIDPPEDKSGAWYFDICLGENQYEVFFQQGVGFGFWYGQDSGIYGQKPEKIITDPVEAVAFLLGLALEKVKS